MAAAQAAAAVPAAALPSLKTITTKVSPKPEFMFMSTNNTSMGENECLFQSAEGGLMFRLQNSNGVFSGKKVLYDGHGAVLLTCKKNPLSLAKWSISLPDGSLAAKTSTLAGMVKYGIEATLASHPGCKFVVAPDPSLQNVMMWQVNAKGVDDTPLCEAAYADNVVSGMVSAAMQDWSYRIALDPGADAALVCVLLGVYTDLITNNALSGAFGMP